MLSVTRPAGSAMRTRIPKGSTSVARVSLKAGRKLQDECQWAMRKKGTHTA